MKLSERIRRNPHIVDQQMQHKWADEVAQLEDDIKKIEINTDAYADENEALKDAVLDLYKSKDGTIKESTYIFAEKLYGDALLKESE